MNPKGFFTRHRKKSQRIREGSPPQCPRLPAREREGVVGGLAGGWAGVQNGVTQGKKGFFM
jgi:hypothetical protein